MAIIAYSEGLGFYLIAPDGSPITSETFGKARHAEDHARRLGLSVLNGCADECD